MDYIKFTENLAKGKIAELIFAQMLRETENFTILSFGYESVLPELASRQSVIRSEETMEIIRRAPDFAVINNENHEVHLIEVKYMKHITAEKVYQSAKLIYESWKPSYLFICTPEGFFYDRVKDIVEKKGKITPFGYAYISEEAQKKYTSLLNKFICP